ncbi:MAG: BMP family ABC transporter substrate-binding protein [Bacillota bacterium]|nr:BMP family ABC transporter substrate-binding protein [Bacillota bacterium]
MKRTVLFLLVCALVLSLIGAVGAAPKYKVAMVTDIGGLGDQSFNDAAYRGLQRAAKELGVEIKVVESKKMDDYETNLSNLADQKFDEIWAIGFLMTDALKNVAKRYPNTKFGIIDSVVDAPNVMSVVFKEEEGSFLQGVLAGKMTKSNIIGYIGGMEFPLIIKFESGFIAGVRSVNPKARVLVGYTGKFDDPGKGKELAMTQFSQGADIIYHASGACGIGVIEAAKEKKLLAIGVDSDQSHLAPAAVLSSMLKRVDTGVFMGAKALVEGNWKSGTVVLGLKEDGVGTGFGIDRFPKDGVKVPADVRKLHDKAVDLIKSGKLVVPSTREEVAKFKFTL